MSNQLVLSGAQLPTLNLPVSIVAKVQAQFAAAAANATVSMPRLSFRGRTFNISVGGDTVELPDRVLDVHIVAVDPQFHYSFYEKSYTGTDADKEGRTLSRYPLPTDEFEFKPTDEWAQRVYRQRAVVMLAKDPEHKLYVVDFGYNSVRKTGNPALGLMNLSQLVTQMDFYTREYNGLLPFMFTVQLSFTRASVPEIQFSLHDQFNQSAQQQARFAAPEAINAMVAALESGEVDKLMVIEHDSAAKGGSIVSTYEKTPAPVPVPQPVPTPQPVMADDVDVLAML